MKTLPTAEEFIEQTYSFIPFELDQITELMQEFAKLHVKAALESATNNLSETLGSEEIKRREMDEIVIESYPLYKIT